jgi:hypothetical protein
LEITIRELVENNLQMFYKLDLSGVKSINTAIDYLSICEEYEKYNWIKSEVEKKEVVASKFKVTVRTVNIALSLMRKKIELKTI